MAKFIRIPDANKQIQYVNVDHIVQFHAAGANMEANTVIITQNDIISTALKCDEIMKLIQG